MYDLIIIGGGWAGLNAAKRAKELGLKACLIEEQELGGTCLNRGCIPTKALIQSAKIYTLVKKSSLFGINTPNSSIDFVKIQERKEKIIQQFRRGMDFMLKGIDVIIGEAKFLSDSEVSAGDKILKAKSILIASGSVPAELNNIRFDGKKVVSSGQILKLRKIPSSLLVIGGGVIGCEFASLFCSLGTRVTIAEKMPQLLPGIDSEPAKKIEIIFKKKGIKVNTNADAAVMDLKDYELVLLSVGRSANTAGLQLQKAGIAAQKGRISADGCLRTNIPNIYAAGDCTQRVMLAHYAAYQGRLAAWNIANPSNPQEENNPSVPNCIFTDPEIATVGLGEEEAGLKGINIKVDKFDFLGSAMARILDEAEGFIKIISDAKTNQILGASIIGPRATEIIAVLSLAVSARLKISQIRDTIFAHPTISECLKQAVEKE